MFTDDIKKAIDTCISLNIPFAVYSTPSDNNITFFANPSSPEESKAYFDGRNEFVVNFFNNDYPYTIGIQPELNAIELLQIATNISPKASPEISPWTRDTEYLQYCSQAHQIIQELKRAGGKTVLSRVITGEMIRKSSDVIEEYFNCNPNAFCYAYMTRETGCWLGATPEILYKQNIFRKQKQINLENIKIILEIIPFRSTTTDGCYLINESALNCEEPKIKGLIKIEDNKTASILTNEILNKNK